MSFYDARLLRKMKAESMASIITGKISRLRTFMLAPANQISAFMNRNTLPKKSHPPAIFALYNKRTSFRSKAYPLSIASFSNFTLSTAFRSMPTPT